MTSVRLYTKMRLSPCCLLLLLAMALVTTAKPLSSTSKEEDEEEMNGLREEGGAGVEVEGDGREAELLRLKAIRER